MARDTGGEAFFNTNDMSGRLQKALNDNRVYYALAYHAPAEGAGDKNNQFRRITLRVKNHPEYRVRAQRGYLPFDATGEEQAATPRQRLIQAMAGPLPVTTIPVALSADYFERDGAEGQVSLQVYIDANAVKYHEQDRNYLFDLELAATIYDLTGKRVHVSTNEAHGKFTPERLEAAKRNGYRYAERVSLKPGVYQVRVGVLEPATEKIGTAIAWVDVPDLGKGKLNMSAIILGRNSEAVAQKTASSAAPVSLSPAVTQGIRVYKRGEILDYNLMVYPASGKGEADGELSIQTEIVQGEQQVYRSEWQAVSSRALEKDKKGTLVAGNLKLNNVKPGIYELRVRVKDSKSKKPAERAILFGVEP